MRKYFINPVKQRLRTILINQKQVDEWIKGWKFFFILGFGRSGTVFMANLLNKAPDAHVFHEPVLEDFFAHARTHYNPKNAYRYIQTFRKKEIYSRMHRIPTGIYGEVNSAIRCHAEALKKAFPEVTLVHLVRDGRDVVRSTIGRRTMTIKNPFSQSIRPVESDPRRKDWDEMDRFARICWFWQEENRRLRALIGKSVQFEKLLSDYDYFVGEILGPCGLKIDKKTWRMAIASPRNSTRQFSIPKWDEWTPEHQKTFMDICGDEMEKCGYSF